MSCRGCKERRKAGYKQNPDAPEYFIMPDEPCVLCAEKHLSTAWSLAREAGYTPVNRQHVIGELVACQWHIFRAQPDFAEQVRQARHLLQWRKEQEIDWRALLEKMDALVVKDLKAEQEMRT